MIKNVAEYIDKAIANGESLLVEAEAFKMYMDQDRSMVREKPWDPGVLEQKPAITAFLALLKKLYPAPDA